jgi:hypothetical protein
VNVIATKNPMLNMRPHMARNRVRPSPRSIKRAASPPLSSRVFRQFRWANSTAHALIANATPLMQNKSCDIPANSGNVRGVSPG